MRAPAAFNAPPSDASWAESRSQKIRICVHGDNVSRELFEFILKDEEAHVDWLEAQMHQIKELGYERYLTQQIGEGEDD